MSRIGYMHALFERRDRENHVPHRPYEMTPGKIYTVYATVINSDSTEGRGRDYDIGYFWDQQAAVDFGRKRDVMGSDGRVAERQVTLGLDGQIWLLDRPVLPHDSPEHAKRAAALKKARETLTAEELTLLGIKP